MEPLSDPYCHYCARPLSDNLRVFQGSLNYPEDPICGSCRKRPIVLDRVYPGYRLTDVLDTIIDDWKFSNRSRWGNWLGRKLWHQVGGEVSTDGWDAVVPVPLHHRRRKNRGFNQAGQLGRGIQKVSDLTFENILRKHRRTEPQSSLGREERTKNLKGAFSIAQDKYKIINKTDNILLIDDIYTTGSTLREAANVLLNEDVRSVGAIVLARTLDQGNGK